MKKQFDYLIVGAGLSGASLARELLDAGKKVLVIEKRNHIGGNIFTSNIYNIPVHVYGPHIFHTDKKEIFDYFNKYVETYPFINSPLAFFKGNYYHMPFNMNTFNELWGVKDIEEAKEIIEKETAPYKNKPINNLEEQALSLVGPTIYKTLIKGYTEKQWGRSCNELPSSIIKRLPLRFEYNNNYFNDPYQAMPKGGFTPFIENLLSGASILLEKDYLEDKEKYDNLADTIIYTGRLDEYFGFSKGRLEYRSLRFEVEILKEKSYQGNAVVNYTDNEPRYTRICEHKYFDPTLIDLDQTIITKEYPAQFKEGMIPYYTINDERNTKLAATYLAEASKLKNVYFLGRLATYRYLDMDDSIFEALSLAKHLLKRE